MDEQIGEEKDNAGSPARAGEEGNKEKPEAEKDHDLGIHFEAGSAEIEDEDGEEHYEGSDYDHPEVREEEWGDDTFYDIDGIFAYEEDEDIYYEMEGDEEQ